MLPEIPFIQIITPYYNADDSFPETAACLYNQSFTNWEWILVNDGSTSPLAIRQLDVLRKKNDARIKIIDLPANKGLPASRNEGVRAATADYIFFLDADDLIEPDYLEKAWITLSLNPAFSFVNSWSTGFGTKTYDWRVGLEKKNKFLDENWVAFAGLFRREVLLQTPFNESRREGLEDWEFWLEAASNGYWGYTLPEKLFHYRIHAATNKWANWDNGKRQKAIKKIFRKKYRHMLKKDFPDPGMATLTGSLPVLAFAAGPVNKVKPLIMVVLPWLNPGGVEQFTLAWMKALQPAFDYILVTTNDSAENDNPEFKNSCTSVFHFSHLADISMYPALADYVIRSREPDLIVLSHAEPFYHLLPFIRQHFPALPVADINHIENMQWQDGGYPKISALLTAYIDRHIVVSKWLQQFMQAQGVAAEKLQTLYINTDTDVIRPLSEADKKIKRQQYSLSSSRTIILFSGRLTHQKNVLVIPDIAEILLKRSLDFTMVICGGGPDRAEMEEKIYRKDLQDHFILTGTLDHMKAIDYMQSADILLLPSAWEGIATVLYESMASGLPVVATNVGGHRELVTPECGILIELPAKDRQLAIDAADALQKLLEDPSLRHRLGQAARERVVQHFDSKFTWSELKSSLSELLSDKQLPKHVSPSQAAIFQNYHDFVQRWNILRSSNTRTSWKNHSQLLRLRKIYKVVTRKRPINYIWRGK